MVLLIWTSVPIMFLILILDDVKSSKMDKRFDLSISSSKMAFVFYRVSCDTIGLD